MRLCKLLCLFLLVSQSLLAQKEANVWYFGKRAGFDFSSGSPKAIKGNMMDQWEGSSVLCDSTGKVILYSDGQWVWNGNHQLVANGQGLMGEQTATQSALIVAKPGSKSLYYLFTASHTAMHDGLFYNLIDVTRQGGTGEVIEKNVLVHKPTSEKLTAYPHRNGRDTWILSHPWNTASFYAYLLTPNGLSLSPVVSQAGTFQGDYIK
jgi:hypothetical protein